MDDRSQALAAVERQTAVLARHFELLHRRFMVHAQLDRAEYLLLRILDETGPADINTLAASLGLNPSTAGRQISALQVSGLVERVLDTDDRRRCVVRATESGARRMREVQRVRTDGTAELLSEWSDEDVHAVAELFGKYNTSVADRYLTGCALQPEAAAEA